MTYLGASTIADERSRVTKIRRQPYFTFATTLNSANDLISRQTIAL